MALALYVRAAALILVRAFIVDESGFLKGVIDNLGCPFHKTLLIRIFNAQEEIPSLVLGN